MRKGVSPLISTVLLIFITISAVFIVMNIAKPTVERAYEAALINEAEQNMQLLDNLIREVASEGTGSLRSVVLKVSDGNYRIVNTSGNFSGALQFKIELKHSPFTAPMLKRVGNLKYTVGMNSAGLIGYWNYNEGSGTKTEDSSGYENHGTLYNGSLSCSNPPLAGAGCPEWVDGKFSKALSFDGIDDYVEILDSPSLDIIDEITVEAWMKSSSSGWIYRRPITINNTQSSNALTDYQVLISLDTASLISAGKMRSDCGDIRFLDSDNSTQLNYWLESGCNSASTKIWVKVPSIPASSTKTIYVYYGNPSASSASNGMNTFIFFDDFESFNLGNLCTQGIYSCTMYIGGTINVTTEEGYGKVVDNIGGAGGVFAYRSLSVTAPVIFEFLYKITASANDHNTKVGFNDGTFNSYSDPQNQEGVYIDDASNRLTAISGGNSANADFSPSVNVYYRVKLVWTSSTTQAFIDTTTTSTTSAYTSRTHFFFGKYDLHTGGDNMRFYYFLLHKYASPEPTTSVGTEEIAVGGISKGEAYGIGANSVNVLASINNQTISTPISSGWNHAVLTYDGSNQKLFVNGNLKVSQPLAEKISTNDLPLIIGGSAFNGTIDEVRIYNRALSEEEIKENYDTKASNYQVVIEYNKIILTGNLRLGKGTHKLCIEKIGELNNKPLVKITAC